MNINKPIRALIVEDVEDDALLLAAELKRGGYAVTFERVDTAAAMRNALQQKTWDIILCDFTMPYFNGVAALQLAKECGSDAPFIFVSGTIGEDVAIEAMKSGAQDYIMKTNLARLAPAVERELHEAQVRRESRQAETAMRESEHKYRHLFEALGDAVFVIVEESGRIIDTNARAENLLGRIRTEILGSNQAQLFAPQNGQPGFDALRAAANGEHPGGCELEVFRHDGHRLPVHASASRIELYGRPLLLTLLRDVSERNRMDEQLRQLSRAVEQSPASIVITNPAGNITYVNPKFTTMTGYTFAEAVGKNPRILKSGETPPEVYQQLWQTITSGKEWSGEFHNKKKNGEPFWESASISPITDEAGTITHFLAVKEDITARRKLEEQFRQTQKMEAFGQLAGGVAHDFNNILSVIQMQASLLKVTGALSPEQLNLTDEISATVQRAADLTRQLLLFSRRETFQPRDLDLSESITNTIKMLRRILGETIEVHLKLAAQPMFVHADANMMDQVLMNLSVNARDAMPGGGHLTIETSGEEFDEFATAQSPQTRPGSFVCLSVSDNGGGIKPEILPKIFEPFFTTKDVGKGTGLGLATVFGIVQQHQGWINAYSEVGHGTTFRIYLPRLAGMTDTTIAKIMLATPPTGNETILLVEDEPSLRASFQKNLARFGYRILEAPTGVKALEVWKEHREEIRLLLTDLVMPDGMTGKDLAQRLIQENPKLKVIYMSGYSAEVAGKDFPLQEGVNFLTKPFEARKLAQIIRNSLDMPAQQT